MDQRIRLLLGRFAMHAKLNQVKRELIPFAQESIMIFVKLKVR